MVKLNARLESAHHILHHILTHEYKAKQTGMQIHEDKIRLDIKCTEDLTQLDKDKFEKKVNTVIKKNLPVLKTVYIRDDVPKDIDISMIPESVKKVRIVAIGDFDIQPCSQPHVNNTSEIGEYRIIEIKRKGKDIYRFVGMVTDKGEIKVGAKKEKFELQLAKGVRDFPPEEKVIRENIITTLKNVFENYGYNPLETPMIERLDVLNAKFAAGDESDAAKEIFRLKDQGGRDLGLRFELTLSLCRFIAMNPNNKIPFKRYEIGRVYRDGPIKLGRYREFWQCDIDIVGTKSMLADAEILAMVEHSFKQLNFDIIIEVSNRKLLNGILEYAGVKPESRLSVMITIDKLKKYGIKAVKEELIEKDISKQSIEKIIKVLEIKDTNQEIILKLKKLIKNDIGKQGLDELEELFNYLNSLNVKSFIFNHTLARGLSYYTGPIFEVFLKDSKIKSSVCGGGRYDDYIGNFLGGKKEIPATGISFGLEPITEAVKLIKKEKQKSVAKIYVIPINTTEKSLEIVQKLRNAGIKSDFDVVGRGISKNLNYANSLGIPYVLFIGEDELKKKKLKLKNMKTGKEESLSVEKIVEKFNNK